MFPGLSPFLCSAEVLHEIGAAGGPMAASTPPERTTTVPAGFVFFGQFIDHDVTLDVTSSLDRVSIANDIPNDRTPTLDLDCVYGAGPEASRFMYDGARLVTARQLGRTDHEADDLPRLNGRAVIGDFRNDENRIVSQLQLGMIRYHNRICDVVEVQHPGFSESEVFEHARQHCTWHYQNAILREFLPAICGQAVVDRILANGPRFYSGSPAFIPVEFSAAAYRFGHSMVPQQVRVQADDVEHDVFGDQLGFGFSPVPGPQAVVDWSQLLPVAARPPAQTAHRCGPKLAEGLLTLSAKVDPEGRSLATRNMERGQSLLLPSGEAVAAAMGCGSAHIRRVSDAASKLAEGRLPGATPLWFWILNEANEVGRESTPDQYEPGEGLGPVGATIVAEVLIGLMASDPRSWLNTNRNFQPSEDQQSISQLLTYAADVDIRAAKSRV